MFIRPVAVQSEWPEIAGLCPMQTFPIADIHTIQLPSLDRLLTAENQQFKSVESCTR